MIAENQRDIDKVQHQINQKEEYISELNIYLKKYKKELENGKRNSLTPYASSILEQGDSRKLSASCVKGDADSLYKQRETMIEEDDAPKAVITKNMLNEIISRHNKEQNHGGSCSSCGSGKCIIF